MSDRRQALDAQLDDLAKGFSGKAALYVKDVASGETIARDPDAVVPTASCIKLFVLMELMRRVAAGEVYMLNDGVWRRRGPGQSTPMPDYCG